MEFFEAMNKKLDEGWKMTDGSCEKCNSLVMYNPVNNTYNCLKCHKPVDLVASEKQDPEHKKKEVEYAEEFTKKESMKTVEDRQPNVTRSDEISKQMSNKLLQGWAMLEKSCDGTQLCKRRMQCATYEIEAR
jgi:uncharacterized Zn finger protein (UPF0148 family)